MYTAPNVSGAGRRPKRLVWGRWDLVYPPGPNVRPGPALPPFPAQDVPGTLPAYGGAMESHTAS